MAHGTVFHHFKTKENLLLEMGEALIDGYLEGLHGLSLEQGTGWEALAGTVRYHFDFMGAHAQGVLVLVREAPRVLGDRFTGPPVEHIRRGMSAVNDLRRRLVERGQADGSIRQCPVAETVFLLDSLLGGIIHSQSKGSVETPAEILEATLEFCRRSLATGDQQILRARQPD